jgi:Uma2 family endonuclease
MSTAARLITAEELFRLPEDETQWCELIEGEIVQISPPGGMHAYVGGVLTALLSAHVRGKRLGAVIGEAGVIVSRDPDTVLAPDGAFVTQEQIAAHGIPEAYFTYPPALVIEVVSPHDTMSEVAAKMRRWLNAGVRLGWVVEPVSRTVTIYRSADDVRILTEKEMLTGEEIVPGFECPVASLFEAL